MNYLCHVFNMKARLRTHHLHMTFRVSVCLSVPVRHLPLSNRKPKIIPARSQYSYFTFYEKHSNKCCVFLGGVLRLIMSEPQVSRGQCRSHLTSSRTIVTLLIVRNRRLWCSGDREWHDVHTKFRGIRSVRRSADRHIMVRNGYVFPWEESGLKPSSDIVYM
jgi:hypothetical protein